MQPHSQVPAGHFFEGDTIQPTILGAGGGDAIDAFFPTLRFIVYIIILLILFCS